MGYVLAFILLIATVKSISKALVSNKPTPNSDAWLKKYNDVPQNKPYKAD